MRFVPEELEHISNTKMAVEITDTPFAAFDKISMECMGLLSLTENGNKYIISCKEQLSKYRTDIPIQDQEAEM